MVSATASPLAVRERHGAPGQAAHVEALSRALAARGHEVEVHTRRESQDLPSEVRVGPRVTVHHIDAGPVRPVDPDELVSFMPDFASELVLRWMVSPPHVAHAHHWDSAVVSAQAGVAARVPVAVTFHGKGSPVANRPRHDAGATVPALDVEGSLARLLDRVIATSQAEVMALLDRGTPADRLAVVPHGVDTTTFRVDGPVAPRVARHHRLLCVGGLAPEGGAEDAIRTLAQLPTCELVVAGGPLGHDLAAGSDVARLRGLGQALGVAERLDIVAAVPRHDMPALIRSADVVLCLPWHDAPVSAVLEAMACGRPIVAADTPGLVEVVDDGETGLIVERRSPSASAMAVRRLLSAPGLRATMSDLARSRVEERFDWRHVAEAAEGVYAAMSTSFPAAPPASRWPATR